MALPNKKKPLAVAVSLSLLSGAAVVKAEELTSSSIMMLEEIVVTAQKREQNMQDTPISMAAFNANAMEKQNINDIADAAQYMPNVLIAESQGGSTGATAAIRGSVSINPAITWEPTVGIYVDGVFVAKNVGGLFDVAEMERMEVLRGPQGTLYGKNTVGGAINLVTRKPGDEFSGTLRFKAGNYNYQEEYLSVDTGKFGDIASFNLAVNKRDRDGFYKNTDPNRVANGSAKRFKELDSTAARFAALFDVSDDLEIYYTFDMNEKDNTPSYGQFDLLGSKLDKRRKAGALDGAKKDTSETKGHALTITWSANDELTFKSISAYRHVKFDDLNDYDGQAAIATQVNGGATPWVTQFHTHRQSETKQASQEFQLLGNYSFVNFVTGLYYFNEDTSSDNPFDLGVIVENKYGVKSKSYALFAQADWLLTEALTLTTGVRYTHEKKDAYLEHSDPSFAFDFGTGMNTFPRVKADDTWSNVSPMMALSYLWENGMNTYFKVSQGWKAGGFNGEAGPDIFSPVPRTAEQVFKQSYDPEKITSYELGLKARWWDNRLQTNLAIFHNQIKDMQVSNYINAYSEIQNAGKAEIQGVEIDVLVQLVQGLTANASYGYTDAKYKKYSAIAGDGTPYGKKNAKFPYTPKQSASVGLDYVTRLSAGELRARIDYSVVGAHFLFDAPANAAATKVKRYGLLNGRIALANMPVSKSGSQTLEVGFWGKNLTNEEYRINGIPVIGVDDPASPTASAVVGAVNYYGDPRTFGVDVTYKW